MAAGTKKYVSASLWKQQKRMSQGMAPIRKDWTGLVEIVYKEKKKTGTKETIVNISNTTARCHKGLLKVFLLVL